MNPTCPHCGRPWPEPIMFGSDALNRCDLCITTGTVTGKYPRGRARLATVTRQTEIGPVKLCEACNERWHADRLR